jgi:hypothetical protein
MQILRLLDIYLTSKIEIIDLINNKTCHKNIVNSQKK